MTNMQINVLDCLEKRMGTKAIAEACACSVSTVKQVRANKDLRKEYDNSRRKSDDNILADTLDACKQELMRLVSNPNSPANVKITAAKQIIEISQLLEAKEGKQVHDYHFKVTYV